MGRNKPSEGYLVALYQQKCSELIPARFNKIDMPLVSLGYAKKSLYFYGDIGSGKTYKIYQFVRTLIYHKVFRQERIGVVKIYTAPALLESIKACFAHSAVTNSEEYIQSIKTCNYLFLDDLGTEKVTDWVLEKFNDIVNYRYENSLHLTVSSNLQLPQIEKHLGSRVYSRLQSMCIPVEVKGKDRRRAV